MHFALDKTFSSSGDSATIESQELEVVPGILHNLIIHFPAGCLYLVYARLVQNVQQVYPTNQDAFYCFEDYTLSVGGFLELKDGETLLKLEGYNEDTEHNHTIRASFSVDPPEILWPDKGLRAVMLEQLEIQKAIFG